MNDDITIAIIGGGPAGLFCALRVAGKGRRVVLFEKKSRPGRKLLLAGSGQCNITHDGEISAFFSRYGDKGAFLRSALMNFTNRDLIGFFADHGLASETDPGGKVFPETRRSADVLATLLCECTNRGVEIRCSESVRSIERNGEMFLVRSGEKAFQAAVIVIATGGASYPSSGSTGDGYTFARTLGLPVTETAPALTPVYVRDYPFADLAGISFESVAVMVYRDGKRVHRQTGDLLLTHTGLSGPVILDSSRHIRPGDVIKFASLPMVNAEAVRERVVDALMKGGARRVKTILIDLGLPERFSIRILDLVDVPLDTTCAHLAKKARRAVATSVAEFPLTVERLGGFSEAMVTRGGISLDGIDPKTMESRIVPNLYCIGEVLDIDGDTGGYNLQAAFSTAALAAREIDRTI